MTKAQAGLKGGLATRAKFGIERCPSCGKVRASGFYAQNGQKGGETTKRLYGLEYYSRIGKMGGRGKLKGAKKLLKEVKNESMDLPKV